MVYQPMMELLAYLRAKDFKTFIVSGSTVEFMRPWTEKIYGIPHEQVIGTSSKTKFEFRNNKPVLVRLPDVTICWLARFAYVRTYICSTLAIKADTTFQKANTHFKSTKEPEQQKDMSPGKILNSTKL
jgi:hypothetical protein